MLLSPLPAHDTKHLPLLTYPFRHRLFYLAQLNDGASNGTALWPGAQCLSAYLAESHRTTPLNVLELGSGIGLTALAMSSMGWHVLATDLPPIISAVLAQNISQNRTNLPPDAGAIHVRELDWTTPLPPSEWTWSHPKSITANDACTSFPDATDSLAPPFDLIVTADTIYIPELTQPLLRALHSLSLLSSTAASGRSCFPVIFICLERRDPALVDKFFADARNIWHFHAKQVPRKKVLKALEKGGLKWQKRDWDDIEIWKLTLRGLDSTMVATSIPITFTI